MQTSLLCAAGGVSPGLRLSLRQALAVHGTITAGVLGLLLFPLSLVPIAYGIAAVSAGVTVSNLWVWLVLAANCANIFAIAIAAVATAWGGLREVGRLRLAYLIPFLPLYWSLMFIAAWHALFQLWREPSRWEKTTHGVTRRRSGPEPLAAFL